MFKTSNFIITPTSTDLNMKIKDDTNRIVHIIKASTICKFHKEADTIIINSCDSTSPIYLKFQNTEESTEGMNMLYDAWIILKTNYKSV